MAMSLRASKKPPGARKAPQIETPVAPPTLQVETPATSARISRDLERTQIASLNDRFAAIIERNKYLDSMNKMLKQKQAQLQETSQQNEDRIRATNEKELAEIRGKGEALAQETANLRVEYADLESKYNEKKAKYEKLDKDVVQKRRQFDMMSDQLVTVAAAIPQLISENERLGEEKNDLEHERNELVDKIENAKLDLEEETMGRLQTESLLQEKLEELETQDQAHQKEKEEVAGKRQVEIKKLDGQLRQSYEFTLQESLRKLREDHDEKVRSSAQLIEAQRGAVGGMKVELKKAQEELQHLNMESNMLEGQLDVNLKNNAEFEKERQGMIQTIDRAEHKSYLDHHVFARLCEEKDDAIQTLETDKEALVNDTQLLMSAKVALDNEISTYRKLLDGAEQP